MKRSSDSKQRMMTAAIDLIWEESYGSVTIDEICKRADVRKGSFYYFFPGKAELAVAAIEEMWRNETKPFLDRHLSMDKEPAQRFNDYLEALVAWQEQAVEEHGKVMGCPVCSVGNEVSTGNKHLVADAIREVFARKRRYYESAIRDAIASGDMPECDPAATATALFGLIDGLVTQARIMNDITLLKNLPQLGLNLLKLPVPAAT